MNWWPFNRKRKRELEAQQIAACLKISPELAAQCIAAGFSLTESLLAYTVYLETVGGAIAQRNEGLAHRLALVEGRAMLAALDRES